MSRRPVVNRDELFFVADKMAAQGKQVTALQILAALGGGSLTTIYKYLAEWESLHPIRPPIVRTNDADNAVRTVPNIGQTNGIEAAALTLEVEKLWKELQSTRSEMLEMRAQIERERVSTSREIAHLKAEQTELIKHASEADAREQLRDEAVMKAAELRGCVQSLEKQNADLLAALSSYKNNRSRSQSLRRR